MGLVAQHGHLLLPEYQFDVTSGQWRHAAGQPHVPMRLSDLRYGSSKLEYPSRHARLPEDALDAQLERALRVFEGVLDGTRPRVLAPTAPRGDDYERLRWFELAEAAPHPTA